MAEATNEEHLHYAAQHGYAMVSIDEDFLSLHDHWQSLGLKHAGIFKIARFLQSKERIGRIFNELMAYSELIATEVGTLEDDINNHVIYVS